MLRGRAVIFDLCIVWVAGVVRSIENLHLVSRLMVAYGRLADLIRRFSQMTFQARITYAEIGGFGRVRSPVRSGEDDVAGFTLSAAGEELLIEGL